MGRLEDRLKEMGQVANLRGEGPKATCVRCWYTSGKILPFSLVGKGGRTGGQEGKGERGKICCVTD